MDIVPCQVTEEQTADSIIPVRNFGLVFILEMSEIHKAGGFLCRVLNISE